jgi:predicted membrane protein (TIGR00267 family)
LRFRPLKYLKELLDNVDTGPSIRRFFINTLFDSTFVLLGVIVGSSFSAKTELRIVLGTMITSSLALSISSGVSVYQAEILEGERNIQKIENSLFTSLEGTEIEKNFKKTALITALVNLLTPIVICILYSVPFVLALFNVLGVRRAAYLSISTALIILTLVGMYMGHNGRGNAILSGIKMLVLGCVTFFAGFYLEAFL